MTFIEISIILLWIAVIVQTILIYCLSIFVAKLLRILRVPDSKAVTDDLNGVEKSFACKF